MGKDAFQLRAEKKFTIVLRIIQRLDAHAVAGKNERPLRLHPNRDAKHSSQMSKAIASPAQKSVQNDFSIATGLKARAAGFKLQPQLMMIEDFAVKDDDHVAIGADKRLVAA